MTEIKLTQDSIFRGKIKVFQPERGKGYRFSIDSVLLGYFASRYPGETTVDLGAGCGIIGFIMIFAGSARQVIFVERDTLLAEACRLGIKANGFLNQSKVIEADVRGDKWFCKLKRVDSVVSNPPYRRKGSGIVSHNERIAEAKHAITMDFHDVIKCASRILKFSGRLFIVVHPESLQDLLVEAEREKFYPVRLCFVHPKIDRSANAVLIELKFRGHKKTSVKILPPLIIHNDDNSFTAEVSMILEGNLSMNQNKKM